MGDRLGIPGAVDFCRFLRRLLCHARSSSNRGAFCHRPTLSILYTADVDRLIRRCPPTSPSNAGLDPIPSPAVRSLRRLYHIYIIYEAHTCAHGSSRYPYMCAYSEISLHQVKLRRLYVVYISGMQVRHACMQLRVIHIEAPFSWHRHFVCRRHVTKKLASVDSYAGRRCVVLRKWTVFR
jgi:hypothetical protein